MRRKAKIFGGFLLLFMFSVYLGNTSRFSPSRPGTPILMAHRGLAQRPDPTPANFGGCATGNILPPRHSYIENTIPSMQAAFERGTDVVEFDIQRTADDQFAVFHDNSLECRTNGQGRIRAHTMVELKAIDIGYRYTFDGGQTYPFRGKGIGLMPSMAEVFEKFPDRSFLVDVKGDDSLDAAMLAEQLTRLTPERQSRLMVFARDNTLSILRERLPGVRMFSARSVADCLVRYIVYGWTSTVPGICRNSPLWVPVNVAPWLWGWPNRFMDRMEGEGAFVILMGGYPNREISPGLDTREDLSKVPADYRGGIWTNDVDLALTALADRP